MDKQKMMYSILFEIDKGNIPNHLDYNLELFMWAEILETMEHRYYIEGVSIYYFDEDEWYDETIHSVVLETAKVTDIGLKFLKENQSRYY